MRELKIIDIKLLRRKNVRPGMLLLFAALAVIMLVVGIFVSTKAGIQAGIILFILSMILILFGFIWYKLGERRLAPIYSGDFVILEDEIFDKEMIKGNQETKIPNRYNAYCKLYGGFDISEYYEVYKRSNKFDKIYIVATLDHRDGASGVDRPRLVSVYGLFLAKDYAVHPTWKEFIRPFDKEKADANFKEYMSHNPVIHFPRWY